MSIEEKKDYPEGVTQPLPLGKGIFVEDRQHWAMNSYAGEGLREVGADASGCLGMDGKCQPPRIAIYRHYWSKKGKISCFLSYPNGMGSRNQYFWEIYSLEGNLFDDIERFNTEGELLKRVKELLT